MTKNIEAVDLIIGQAYNVVRNTNSAGHAIRPITRYGWRAVLVTEENKARYVSGVDGTYLFEPIKCRYTPRLLAAGWTRFSRPKNVCSMEITSSGKLHGLACSKGGNWVKMDVDGGRGMCAQHAAQYI